VRQSGLDQELCHEAERASIEGALGGNGLQEGQEGIWLPGGYGQFLTWSDVLIANESLSRTR
jgi:hypothetical protein